MTLQRFNDFVVRLRTLINADDETFFIFDNPKPHVNVNAPESPVVHKFLPPYSPFLNPIYSKMGG